MASENTPIEQFFAEKAASNANVVAEANRFRTAPAGSYTLQVSNVEGKVWTNETNVRKGAHLTVSIMKAGRKVATAFSDISWEEVRTQKGNLDTKSKLWLQYCKALFPELKAEELAALTTGEVVKAMLAYPVSGFIAKQYIVTSTDEDKARGYYAPTKKQSAKTEDEEKHFLEIGAKPVNTIMNVYALKPEANG